MELQLPAFLSDEPWKAAGRRCGGEVSAELCPCYTSIQSRPGLTQRDPQLLNPDSTLYTQSNA